ncbi:hypothetical protein ABZS88_35340 [Streptomyces sp. NPDC005480]|uniref:hypothetical protein n=1 Tax=Streptomyces sp. NPDC005480 TaxID=3154880 RepID=UPI0033A0B191
MRTLASIRIPGAFSELPQATGRINILRELIPDTVTIGVSGDWAAAGGLNAGCDVWHSVIGGLFPQTALDLTQRAQAGDAACATALSAQLESLWTLFRGHDILDKVAAYCHRISDSGHQESSEGSCPESAVRIRAA